MPVYKPEEYDAVLERIRQEVNAQKVEPGPVLSREERRAFEQKRRIALPKGCRRFLLEAGDGTILQFPYPEDGG